MPSDSTLDSAPEDVSQHPAAEPFEALLAPSLDAPQAGVLDQSGYGGLAAPMDTLDLDPCVVPPLDDGVLNSGSVADVVDTASFVSGISDSLEPLACLGLNPARAMLPGVEPQINSMVRVPGSAVRLSSMADAFHPLGGVGELVGRSHVGLAQVLEGLPALIPPLPGPAKMAGARAPLAKMTEMPAPDGFTVPVGLLQMTQEILPTRPPLADVIGGHVAALFARVRSVADRAKRLRPSVPAEARSQQPRPDSGPPAPATGSGSDAGSPSSTLRRPPGMRRRRDFERDHQIQGFSIGCVPDGWEQRVTVPGPEDLVIPRLVPWAQQFETESVQYVVGRFNEQEQAVLRVRAEKHPMPWTMAPTLVQQDEAQGEHNRRKLKRVAKEWRRHENNRRELP